MEPRDSLHPSALASKCTRAHRNIDKRKQRNLHDITTTATATSTSTTLFYTFHEYYTIIHTKTDLHEPKHLCVVVVHAWSEDAASACACKRECARMDYNDPALALACCWAQLSRVELQADSSENIERARASIFLCSVLE